MYIFLVLFADVLLETTSFCAFLHLENCFQWEIIPMLAASTEELGVILLQARISLWGTCGFLFNGFILVVSVTSRGWMGVDICVRIYLNYD